MNSSRFIIFRKSIFWNLPVLILLLMAAGPSSFGALAGPQVRTAGMDSNGHFVLTAEVPAGAGYAVLEMLTADGSPPWKPMVAGAVDGRPANVVFRLPRTAGGSKALVRVRTGAGSVPAAELPDPALYEVSYEAAPVVTYEAKKAFLDAAGPEMVARAGLPPAERHAGLIAWAKLNPVVAEAGALPNANNIYVEFVDGDITVLMDPRRTAAPDPGVVGQSKADVRIQTLGEPEVPLPPFGNMLPASVPDSNVAITAFSLESSFPNSAPTIAGWLRRHSYDTTEFPSTTAAQIAQWSSGGPIGVLFWHAHGVTWEKKKSGILSAGLVTGELMTEELEKGAYAKLRADGELFTAKDGNAPATYFITTRFVKKWLKFAPHSLVVIDACYGANEDLVKTFLEAGAGACVSWDWESGPHSGTPCLQIFDRLLGINEEPPLSQPKERSFSLEAVRYWMQGRGYDFDPSPKHPNQTVNNARLVWKTHSTAPAHILRPSIMRVLTQFSGHEGNFTALLLEGDFGRDPGTANRKVLWAGNPVKVLSWDQQDGIVIQPPVPPPGGDFEVILKNRHHSNLLPVSRWTVPFTYTYHGPGSLTYKVEMNANIIGDVHGSRGLPEDPVQMIMIPFGSFAGGTGQVTASGVYSPDPDTVISWSGGTSMESVDMQTSTGVEVDKFQFQGALNMGFARVDNFSLISTGRFTETVDGNAEIVGAPVLGLTWPPPQMGMIPHSSAISGNTLSFSFENASATLSWPTVLPVAAPQDTTVR